MVVFLMLQSCFLFFIKFFDSASYTLETRSSMASADTKVDQDFKKGHVTKKNDSIFSVLAGAGYPKLGKEKLFPQDTLNP